MSMPAQIGRYQIRKELGRGGMATVYEALDPTFNRTVAVKVLPREFLHEDSFRARFGREAQMIASLEHPAIVPVYDFGEHEGMPFLVMRYMGGGSLADRLRRGPLSAREAAQVLNRLAPALDLAHTRGVVHRDLKPANILFDDNGEPHISDFGIAKLTNSQQQTELTRGMIVGTPHYMSPEQARGEPLDGRSDLYALGAIVFEMLTGKFPYDAENPTGVMMKHIIDPVPQLARVQPNLAADWQRVVDTALAKKREERFQTASAMADAVTATAHGRAPVSIDPGKTLVWPGDGAPVAQAAPSPPMPVPAAAGGPPAQVMPRLKPLTMPAPTPVQKRSGGTALALLAFALVGIACLLVAGYFLLR